MKYARETGEHLNEKTHKDKVEVCDLIAQEVSSNDNTHERKQFFFS